jgi:hypothetical protein
MRTSEKKRADLASKSRAEKKNSPAGFQLQIQRLLFTVSFDDVHRRIAFGDGRSPLHVCQRDFVKNELSQQKTIFVWFFGPDRCHLRGWRLENVV